MSHTSSCPRTTTYDRFYSLLEEMFTIIPEGVHRLAEEDPHRVRKDLVTLIDKSSSLVLASLETINLFRRILNDGSESRFETPTDSDEDGTTYSRPDQPKDPLPATSNNDTNLKDKPDTGDTRACTQSESESDSGTDYDPLKTFPSPPIDVEKD